MIVIIVIIIIMIIITFTDAIRDFLQSPHCAVSCLQHVHSSWPGRNRMQITCNTSSSCHVQYIVLYATWYEGTAQLLSLIELKSHLLSFILLAEPLTDEGGEETGVPGENPWRRAFRKCHILKPEDSSSKRDSNPHSSIGGRLGKQAC